MWLGLSSVLAMTMIGSYGDCGCNQVAGIVIVNSSTSTLDLLFHSRITPTSHHQTCPHPPSSLFLPPDRNLAFSTIVPFPITYGERVRVREREKGREKAIHLLYLDGQDILTLLPPPLPSSALGYSLPHSDPPSSSGSRVPTT